jgi:hypothetical protein
MDELRQQVNKYVEPHSLGRGYTVANLLWTIEFKATFSSRAGPPKLPCLKVKEAMLHMHKIGPETMALTCRKQQPSHSKVAALQVKTAIDDARK